MFHNLRLETLILQWNEEKTEIVQILRSQLEITTNEEVSVTLASRLREKYDLRGKGQNVHPVLLLFDDHPTAFKSN